MVHAFQSIVGYGARQSVAKVDLQAGSDLWVIQLAFYFMAPSTSQNVSSPDRGPAKPQKTGRADCL